MLLSGLHHAPSVVQSGGEWEGGGRANLGENSPSIAHVHQQGVGRSYWDLHCNLALPCFDFGKPWPTSLFSQTGGVWDSATQTHKHGRVWPFLFFFCFPAPDFQGKRSDRAHILLHQLAPSVSPEVGSSSQRVVREKKKLHLQSCTLTTHPKQMLCEVPVWCSYSDPAACHHPSHCERRGVIRLSKVRDPRGVSLRGLFRSSQRITKAID